MGITHGYGSVKDAVVGCLEAENISLTLTDCLACDYDG
jgi:hypothetical protein